jgi:Lon protease-like protein
MTERDMPEVMPVFPLSNTVLFPHTSLPLHVFEPRYRQMVEDVQKLGRWISVTLLRPGAEADDPERPPFHDVAGAGFLIRSNRLPDGRFHIILDGRKRVRLQEIESDRMYRIAQASAVPEDREWLGKRDADERLGSLVELASGLGMMKPRPQTVPRGKAQRAALVNLLASVSLADPLEKQAMLAAEFEERVDRILKQLQFSRGLLDSMARFPKPDDPRWN